jgi:L-alanine-DL-glutamate epimerase-like enolase superfamily enzyme
VGPLKLRTKVEHWPLTAPFRITGHTWEYLDVLSVTLESEGRIGRGEAAGVYYRDDAPPGMMRQIETVRARVETGITREKLQQLLPPGGARNALDCALWDLEAKVMGLPAWKIAGLEAPPHPLLTTYTVGADEPEKMAAAARAFEGPRAIKVKLTGEAIDADRIRAIREAKPDVWLGVDGNQGFTRASLESLLPTLAGAGVLLIEQPFPIGKEAWLDGLGSPIPIAADESVQSLIDIGPLANRVQVINIKLDKCGGLTEGLAMARWARELGLVCMVGNMMGTSLAMAPGYVLGQLCRVVDLDGPLFLKGDREQVVSYEDGFIACPDGVWGSPVESPRP